MGEKFKSPGHKNAYVRKMFNDVSHHYDFLNHLLSIGIDRYWRKRAIKILELCPGELFLDVACGTGDLSIEAAKRNPSRMVATDFAEEMLHIFTDKKKGLSIAGKMDPVQANAERLPFVDSSFDAAAVAFGVRNFGNLESGLSELHRVIKKGGRVVILEFSKPSIFPIKQLYFFYFKRIVPLIGSLISGDRAAYSYLPNSVETFPDGKSFEDILLGINFYNVRSTPFTFGIATAYFGVK